MSNKTQNKGLPWQFCLESIDPPSKNLRYPLPWIFNPCVPKNGKDKCIENVCNNLEGNVYILHSLETKFKE